MRVRGRLSRVVVGILLSGLSAVGCGGDDDFPPGSGGARGGRGGGSTAEAGEAGEGGAPASGGSGHGTGGAGQEVGGTSGVAAVGGSAGRGGGAGGSGAAGTAGTLGGSAGVEPSAGTAGVDASGGTGMGGSVSSGGGGGTAPGEGGEGGAVGEGGEAGAVGSGGSSGATAGTAGTSGVAGTSGAGGTMGGTAGTMGGTGGTTGGTGGTTGGTGGTTGGTAGTMGGTAGTTGGTAGTSGTSGAGGSGGSGGGCVGPDPCDCVKVAPDGDDAAAVAANGAVPFATLQPAIDYAAAHPEVSSNVCVAAGPACGAQATYLLGTALKLKAGVGVYGAYESSTFTRCSTSETVISGASVSAKDEVGGPIVLDGFTVDGSIGILRSNAVTLSNLASVPSINVSRSTTVAIFRVAIVGGGIHLDQTTPATLTESTIDSDVDPTLYGSDTALWVNKSGAVVSDNVVTALGQAQPAVVLEGRNTITFTRNNVDAAGDALQAWDGYAEIVENVVTAGGTGVEIYDCLSAGTWVQGNDIQGVTGFRSWGYCGTGHVDSNRVRATGPDAAGLDCYGGCAASGNDISVTANPAASTARGVFCQFDCRMTDNDVIVDADGGQSGIDIDAADADILRNRIILLGSGAGSGLDAEGGLVERNLIDAPRALSIGDTGVRVSEATLRNNMIVGNLRAQPWQQPSQLLVEHNTIVGSLLIDGEGGRYLGNIVRGNVLQGPPYTDNTPWPVPAWDQFLDNDLLPVGAYFFIGSGGINVSVTTLNAFNALYPQVPYSALTSRNFSDDPLFGPGKHLTAGSPCIDRGATAVTGDIDIDGEARTGKKDVGADEYSAGPPCRGFSCNGPGLCLDIGFAPTCDCDAGYLNPPGDQQSCVVDACAAPSPCDPLTTCSNTFPGFSCSPCPSGYSGSGDTGCYDQDQCLTNNGGCDPLTQCIDEPTGRSCGPCPSGYLGDGETGCLPDDCSSNNGGCDPLTTCTNDPGGSICGACPSGYVGDGSTGCVEVVCGDVTFVDANLEAAVRSALSIPTGPISGAEAVSLQVLSAPNLGITDLTGLECFTGLTSLGIGNNQITSLMPLDGLPKLASLNVLNNKLGHLVYWPSIVNLDVAGNLFANTDEFAALTTLRTLDISTNYWLTDLDGLANLPNLDVVDLHDTPAYDLGGLISALGSGNVAFVQFINTVPGPPCSVKCSALEVHVGLLEAHGVTVYFTPCSSVCP